MSDSWSWYFAYGLTLSGQRYYDAYVAGRLQKAPQAAVAPGRLVYLAEADCPALLPEEGLVQGQLLLLNDAAWEALDYLHGANPQHPELGEFARRELGVRLPDGSEVEAQSYFMRAEVLRRRFPNAPYIVGGDWLAYLAQRPLAQRKPEALED